MSHTNEGAGRPNALSVTDLFTRYLERQVEAHAGGLGYPEPGDHATPFDVAPVQPVDPQLAWKDATAAGPLLHPGLGAAWAVPPDWPVLVNRQEPAVALAFCLGNFPQMVRNLQPLLSGDIALRQPPPVQPPAGSPLAAWAAGCRGEPARYLAAGVLRLAGLFDLAGEALADGPGPGYEALHGNEAAALAWHRGQHERALAGWRALPELPPVLFNRGMAALFLGRPAEAVADLDAAVAQLPETGAWHHLARLYRTLAGA